MEFASAPNDLRVRRRVWIGGGGLLQVVDVLDLRVGTDPVVEAAEVGLPVRQEDSLVVRSPERRRREIPPLSEEEGGDKYDQRDCGVPDGAPVADRPSQDPNGSRTKPGQRVGLGLGRAVEGAADGTVVGAVVDGATVEAGRLPDLYLRIATTTSLSSRRFSMTRI